VHRRSRGQHDRGGRHSQKAFIYSSLLPSLGTLIDTEIFVQLFGMGIEFRHSRSARDAACSIT